MADLTVIIPTRNRWSILAETLAALRQQTVQAFDIIVVVDGTDQDVPHLDGVDILVKPRGGPGAARNAGVQRAKTDLVLFLGDDMIPDPVLVERHRHVHRSHPEPEAAVLGHVVWHPAVADSPVQRWLTWSGTQFDYPNITGDDAGWGRFYSCNVSLKRSFFEAVGGFDEDFTYYYEDLDAGWRLHNKGLVLRYEPGALARHRHSYDLEAVRGRMRGIATGERMMADKHDWFEPFFHRSTINALSRPTESAAWAALGDRLYAARDRVPASVRVRANRWWYQQIGDAFLDVWEGERGLDELRAYLGPSYDERRLREHVQEVEAEEEAAADEASFYRSSTAYLYDLTVFAMTGTKTPYLQRLRRWVPPPARLLDYGCGIGSDGLRLLDQGYQVGFADFDNPSTAYLRWRLEQRGHSADVYDLDRGVPGGFDAVYCFDVIEHLDDPFGLLAELEQRAAVVAVNFLEPTPHDTHVHKPLPIDRLLEHVNRHELLSYDLLHGRSHFVIYRPRRAGSVRGMTEKFSRRVRDAVDHRVGRALERAAPSS